MAQKKKYKSRDEKDLNTNYNHVDPSKLVEFKGSIEDFLAKITHLKPGYLKKPNGRNIIHFWWEDKDSFYMNNGTQTINKNNTPNFKSDGEWRIAKDMPRVLDVYLRDGEYKMYLKSPN
jgi:hypothetical protein